MGCKAVIDGNIYSWDVETDEPVDWSGMYDLWESKMMISLQKYRYCQSWSGVINNIMIGSEVHSGVATRPKKL